jgi:hypothetical protein
MTICFILCSFCTFFPALVSCTKKDLATLVTPVDHNHTWWDVDVDLSAIFLYSYGVKCGRPMQAQGFAYCNGNVPTYIFM